MGEVLFWLAFAGGLPWGLLGWLKILAREQNREWVHDYNLGLRYDEGEIVEGMYYDKIHGPEAAKAARKRLQEVKELLEGFGLELVRLYGFDGDYAIGKLTDEGVLYWDDWTGNFERDGAEFRSLEAVENTAYFIMGEALEFYVEEKALEVRSA